MLPIPNRWLTSVLVSLAVVLGLFYHFYGSNLSVDRIAQGKTWQLQHLSYPRHFDYLGDKWDIRVLETLSETTVYESVASVTTLFSFFTKEGLVGYLHFTFDANWYFYSGDKILFETKPDSVVFLNKSRMFEDLELNQFLREVMDNAYNAERRLITFSDDELIIEVPHMGLVRFNTVDTLGAIEQKLEQLQIIEKSPSNTFI